MEKFEFHVSTNHKPRFRSRDMPQPKKKSGVELVAYLCIVYVSLVLTEAAHFGAKFWTYLC
jgi:hypothetical protein